MYLHAVYIHVHAAYVHVHVCRLHAYGCIHVHVYTIYVHLNELHVHMHTCTYTHKIVTGSSGVQTNGLHCSVTILSRTLHPTRPVQTTQEWSRREKCSYIYMSVHACTCVCYCTCIYTYCIYLHELKEKDPARIQTRIF